MYAPLLVNRFHEVLLNVQYKYLKSCSKDFIPQNLILRTRSCGTAYILNLVGLFISTRGISAGPALEYFYMIHRVGRIVQPVLWSFHWNSSELVWWRMACGRGRNGQPVRHACVYAWANSLPSGRVHLPAPCNLTSICGLVRSPRISIWRARSTTSLVHTIGTTTSCANLFRRNLRAVRQ